MRLLAPLAVLLLLSACSACSPTPAAGEDGGGDEDGGAVVDDEDGGRVRDAGFDDEDDAGSAGDDAGPGEDGGADADGGDADGGGEDAGPPECTGNADCALGNVCELGDCTPGCDDGRDCPASAPQCDTTAPPHGACVECTGDGDCNVDAGSAGPVCFEGACRAACTAAAPSCPTPGICDETNEVCVRCLVTSNCDLGNICTDNDCVPGCADDRDCPAGKVCGVDDQCVDGCTALPDSCPIGAHCVATVCEVGCGTDDLRCGDGNICSEGACRAACDDMNPCPTNETCVDALCVDGCQSDDDCAGTFGTCDGTTGTPGTCRDCVGATGCFQGQICDEPAQTCRLTCTAIGEGTCTFGGGVCTADADALCVPCVEDADCDVEGGETCDEATHECIAPPGPAPALCDACADDDECGGGGALCMELPSNDGAAVDRACGIDCSTGTACPQGFACEFVAEDGVVRGKQCVPASSAVPLPTCAAHRDLVAETGCYFNQTCGANGPDGVCVGATGSPDFTQGACTIACAVDGDCPETYTCGAPPDGAAIPGVCVPPA